MRERPDVEKAESEFADRLWHERHVVLMAHEHRRTDMQEAERAADSIRRELGPETLGPYTDFEWGEVNGKLSALRWVLGEDWDSLDS